MAVRFDADAEDYSSTSAPPATAFTVLLWGMIATSRSNYTCFWSSHASTASFTALETDTDGTTLRVWNDAEIVGNVPLTVGTWYCLAVTLSGTTLTLYSGTSPTSLASVSDASWTGPASPTTFLIGESVWGGEWLNGRLANLKHYSVALTVDEIAAELSQYQPSRTADLVRWHPFVVGGADGRVDYSGAARTLSGGANTTTEDGPPIRWARARAPRVNVATVPSAGPIRPTVLTQAALVRAHYW